MKGHASELYTRNSRIFLIKTTLKSFFFDALATNVQTSFSMRVRSHCWIHCRFSSADPQDTISTQKSAPIGADFVADLLWILLKSNLWQNLQIYA